MGSRASCCSCCSADETQPSAPPLKQRQNGHPGVRTKQIYPGTLVSSPLPIEYISTSNFQTKVLMHARNRAYSDFQKSIQPIADSDRTLAIQANEALDYASSRFTRPLTQDEAAAIAFFTIQDDPNAGYYRLLEALTTKEKEKTEPWFNYLNLFLRALEKLHPVQGDFYQCIPFRADLRMHYLQSTTLYSCLGLVSSNAKMAQEYFHDRDDSKMMVLVYENALAFDISPYSMDGPEKYVIWPGQRLGIRKIYESADIIKVYITTKINHFICPRPVCGALCNQDHKATSRCNGCVYLSHDCSRHCKPACQCEFDGRQTPNLFQCKRCQGKFCQDCSMRDDDLWH